MTTKFQVGDTVVVNSSDANHCFQGSLVRLEEPSGIGTDWWCIRTLIGPGNRFSLHANELRYPTLRDLPVGTYRLNADVINPKRDKRRTRDWNHAKTFAAGSLFVVEWVGTVGQSPTEDEINPASKRLCYVRARYESMDALHETDRSNEYTVAQLAALLPHLEKCPDTFESMYVRRDWGRYEWELIMEHRFETGVWSEADIESMIADAKAWGEAKTPQTEKEE